MPSSAVIASFGNSSRAAATFSRRCATDEVPRYQARPSPAQTGFSPELDATVKWFNPDKGFGFVALADGSGDVFLHANTLTNAGHSSVSPGASRSSQHLGIPVELPGDAIPS